MDDYSSLIFIIVLFVGLFTVSALVVWFVFRLQKAADDRQRARYERQEWEAFQGKDKVSLLRAARSPEASSQTLLRAAKAASSAEDDTDSLLRPSRLTEETGGAQT